MEKVNFLIIGPPKSGTTTLYNAFVQHSDLYCPPHKEIHFFNRDKVYQKGIDHYHKIFGERREKLFEASPGYLASKDAPKRIKEYNPDIKLISILRDPVERAYSRYLHDIQYGAIKIDLSFEEALKEKNYYIENGKYIEHLKRYLKYFDRNQNGSHRQGLSSTWSP